jgi:hypothetical protein
MKRSLRLPPSLLLLFLLFSLFLAIGCRRTTPPGPNTVYGTIEGDPSFSFLTWDEGLRLMLWYDGASGVWFDGSGSTEDPVYHQSGHAQGANGQELTWTLDTENGQTATFQLAGQRYDLAQGALFLISFQGEQPQVRQVDRDLSGVTPTVDGVTAFGRADPDIAAFIDP